MRFLTLSLLLCASLILPLRASLPSQPNIVLILTDDLGWRDTGWNSDGFIETPNLDRLRQESTSFTQAYACAGNCAPSRACLLSGPLFPDFLFPCSA